MAPKNISAIRGEIWRHVKPQRMAPDAAMMVLEAKVMPKLFAAAIVYRPTATVQQANDALMVRCRRPCGRSRACLCPATPTRSRCGDPGRMAILGSAARSTCGKWPCPRSGSAKEHG